MKKGAFFALLLMVSILAAAKFNLFLGLDKVAKEPRLKQEMKSQDGTSFADDLISIVWEPRADGFRFELTNKNKAAVTIPWDDCLIITEDGVSHRIIHTPAGKTLTIDAKATVAGIVAPADYLSMGKKSWDLNPIFQERWSDSEFETIKNKDLVYRVILPIKKDKVKIAYHFIFKAYAR